MRLSATGNSCGGILPLAGTTVRATERSADDSPDGAPVGVELASIVEGPQSYHMGIIDILQVWSLRKRLERFAKTWFRCSNADGSPRRRPLTTRSASRSESSAKCLTLHTGRCQSALCL